MVSGAGQAVPKKPAGPRGWGGRVHFGEGDPSSLLPFVKRDGFLALIWALILPSLNWAQQYIRSRQFRYFNPLNVRPLIGVLSGPD